MREQDQWDALGQLHTRFPMIYECQACLQGSLGRVCTPREGAFFGLCGVWGQCAHFVQGFALGLGIQAVHALVMAQWGTFPESFHIWTSFGPNPCPYLALAPFFGGTSENLAPKHSIWGAKWSIVVVAPLGLPYCIALVSLQAQTGVQEWQ